MISFKRLFLIIFAPVALLLLLLLLFIYKNIDENNSEQLQKIMHDKWGLVAMYEFHDPKSISAYNFIKAASDNSSLRITIISTDGVVLNDSGLSYKEVKNMQNHKSRDEVRNAINDTPFYAVRKSPSTNENTIYYAKKMDSGNILRISYHSAYLENISKNAKSKTITIFAIIIALIALVSLYLAYKFSSPIKKLNNVINEIVKGNKNYHLPQFEDSTINKIADMIYKMYTNRNNERILAENGRIMLSSILSTMDEAILLFDTNGKVIHFNEQAEKLLQMKLFIGGDIVASSNDVEFITLFTMIFTKRELSEDNFKYKGRIFEIYTKDINGELLLVISDITEKAEYELFKTELVSNITHELKTPITLVMGASETILNDDAMPESIKRKFLETIHRNSIKLNAIVDDTLELHRLENDNEDIPHEPINVQDVFDEVISLLTLNNEKKIIANINVQEVNIANEHLTSILSNLISNAIKYSHGDEITVTISQDKALIIEVADLGPLIPEVERKRIFERFYTVSKSRTKNRSGTGLGLAIVKHIANKYNGSVKVFRNENNGNTFQIKLYNFYTS